MDSILTSIKKLLGLDEDYIQFDADIIIYINSVLMTLGQLGVGPEGGYIVADKMDKWADYLGEETNIEVIKPYIYLKVRLLFDPPSSTAMFEAMERMLKEMEYRIVTQVEGGE